MQAQLVEQRVALRPRADAALPGRLAESLTASQGALLRTEEVGDWLADVRRRHAFRVERIPFSELDRWSFHPDTGNLVHASGKFFTVEGLRVSSETGPRAEWYQPIIKQPEVGILGILVKRIGGVLHFLMQAKMEPGNPNLLQLSPTVQATRSNYTRVHEGAPVRYLDYFRQPGRGRVVADVLQSEHGSWFHRKNNRNMIVEVDEEVEPHADFCWLTLGQIGELLHRDNVINMDARTVLACAPIGSVDAGRAPGSFLAALAHSRHGAALHPDVEVLSWLTAERARLSVRAERVPLGGLPGWVRGTHAIGRPDGRFFEVVALSVEAGSREVSRWTQPVIEPRGMGINAFVTRRIDGVLHVLVAARAEAGFLGALELGPTVQCVPGNHDDLPIGDRPAFLDLVLGADPATVRYQAVHSEEGGRFLNAESRYLVLEPAPEQAPLDPPAGFCWVTVGQLMSLVRHNNYVNVQARSLLACLNGMLSGLPA
ncbi:NDP-hexose 2,3-dehydratase family protein [Actinoplanes oblitus]|uniref:NDP-hexose 2,3-dehydratase family protein n=1 Tax=Actinoplanes oblitus TaxID=3040509 RepID=A0ABY8W9I4_9ACTN|nr:NDP-hexose 2,3-dehydratase family protein [Actinoplanes oblitus]WIM94465.1 NDP-hexose 2,3-dehydratase family protein [Actinoplanes oblitus]